MSAFLPTKSAVLGVTCALLSSFPTNGQFSPVGPAEVCDDFVAGRYPGLPWSYDDCLDVWAHFEGPLGPPPQHPQVDLWRETAFELRQQGSPCMLSSAPGDDGVGSTAIRHVATWLFAEEMGCDWFTTKWASNQAQNADGSTRYCHEIVPLEERKTATNSSGVPGISRCSAVNWLSYFQFDQHSLSLPSSGSVKLIREVSEMSEYSPSCRVPVADSPAV